MKKAIALSLVLISTGVMADTPIPKLTEAKQATAFTGLGLLGLAAGGPVGLFVGAVSGAYIGEQFKKADSLDGLHMSKLETERQLNDTRQELGKREQAMAQLEQSALESLQLQILFAPGSDQLTPAGKQQVLNLASFLVKNPSLLVHLTGHSDPRGTDDYNDLLSHQRAMSIQHALEQVGIDTRRVSVSAHGSAFSQATRGKLETYAYDRRVDIEISKAEPRQVAKH